MRWTAAWKLPGGAEVGKLEAQVVCGPCPPYKFPTHQREAKKGRSPGMESGWRLAKTAQLSFWKRGATGALERSPARLAAEPQL